jgi:hypothetical protein
VLAGAGYIPAAAIAAVFVLLAHLTLRPIAQRLDRLPATTDTEVESNPASAPSPGTPASPPRSSPLRNSLAAPDQTASRHVFTCWSFHLALPNATADTEP